MRYRAEVIQEKRVQGACRHHWIIEAPSGPTSRGICKLCGAKEEFRNSLVDDIVLRPARRQPDLPESSGIDFDAEQNQP